MFRQLSSFGRRFSTFVRCQSMATVPLELPKPQPIHFPTPKNPNVRFPLYDDELDQNKHNELMNKIKMVVATMRVKGGISIDYFSDVHVDITSNVIPKINQRSNILAFLGDAGKPTHPKFDEFVKMLSSMYKIVFFVPGNHEYGCTSIYDQRKYDTYSPLLKETLSKYNNIVLMDNNTYMLPNGVHVIGSTMWTMPFFPDLTSNVLIRSTRHIEKHYADTNWLISQLNKNKQENIKTIVLSHMGPSFDMISDEFKKFGCDSHSKFFNRYDFLLQYPVMAWLYGHTHTQNDKHVNNVFCSVSAHGHSWENGKKTEITPKVLTV